MYEHLIIERSIDIRDEFELFPLDPDRCGAEIGRFERFRDHDRHMIGQLGDRHVHLANGDLTDVDDTNPPALQSAGVARQSAAKAP
jgi:hypothetical protein